MRRSSFTLSILFGTVSTLALVGAAHPQEMERPGPSEGTLPADMGGPYNDMARAEREERSDAPLTTRFSLNGDVLDAGSSASATLGLLDSDQRDAEPLADAVIPFDVEVTAGINAGVGVRRQSGWYAQLQGVERSRTVEWERQVPVDLIGFDLDLTATGRCLLPIEGGADGGYCSYTPGILVRDDDIDPDSFLPGRFIFDAPFGEEIAEETHLAVQEGGFQRGTAEEPVGISVQIPNAGEIEDPTRRSQSGLERTEQAIYRPVLTFSHVEQTLRSSDTRASMDRTIRGAVLLEPDEWDADLLAVQLAAFFLPSWKAGIESSEGGLPRSGVSNNLFYAANNVRYPANSFTIFETGAGYVDHPDRPPMSRGETPTAFYNSFWLGMSPVRSVTRTTTSAFTTTGDRVVEESSYSEGSVGLTTGDLFAGGVTIVDTLDGEITSLNLQGVEDLYVQTGIEITRQAATRNTVTTQRSSFDYVPHLSFTGNRTSGRSVFRYYAGAMDPDDPNFYAGLDFAYAGDNGLRFTASAIRYTDPDYDYYSRAEVSLSQDFAFDGGGTLTIGASGAVEFDRPSIITELADVTNGSDDVELFSQYRADWGRVTARMRASGLRDGEREESATLGLALPLFGRGQLSLQVTPYSEADAYVVAGAGLAVPIADRDDAPVFQAQYLRVEYDFGEDVFGQSQTASEDMLRASLQFEF